MNTAHAMSVLVDRDRGQVIPGTRYMFETQSTRYNVHKAVSYSRLLFKLHIFFCSQVTFFPVKRGNRAGSSRNESDSYSGRGTQISFPLRESRSCQNFGRTNFFNCVVRYLTVDQNGQAVCYVGLFFEVANRDFCFQASFCPVKRINRAGSSRNEPYYSRRGTQICFPLLESRSCENFRLLIAHFSNAQSETDS